MFSVCLCLQSGVQTRLEQTSNVLNDEVLTQYFVMYCRLTLLLQDQVNNFGLYCRLTQTLDERTEIRIEKKHTETSYVSAEIKAPVSFSDHLLSVVSVLRFFRIFFFYIVYLISRVVKGAKRFQVIIKPLLKSQFTSKR